MNLSQYSKLIAALLGNLVAILLAYAATKWTGVATCSLADGVQTCTAFGFSQAQITAGLMTLVNAIAVYFAPKNTTP